MAYEPPAQRPLSPGGRVGVLVAIAVVALPFVYAVVLLVWAIDGVLRPGP